MAGVTIADIWRIYVKPSMGGRAIIRKKTVNRKSARVLERNKQLASAKPAAIAKRICMERYGSVCVYTAPDGSKKCYWECFVRALREAFRESGLTRRPG